MRSIRSVLLVGLVHDSTRFSRNPEVVPEPEPASVPGPKTTTGSGEQSLPAEAIARAAIVLSAEKQTQATPAAGSAATATPLSCSRLDIETL